MFPPLVTKRAILMLHSHLCPGVPSCLFLSRLLTKILYAFFRSLHEFWDTRWRSNTRYCATSRKVAGSISGGPWIDSTSNKTEYQGYFLVGGWGEGGRCFELKTLPPTRGADCLEISNSWKFQGLSKPVQGLFYLTVHSTYISIPTRTDFIILTMFGDKYVLWCCARHCYLILSYFSVLMRNYNLYLTVTN